jgi:hypothetical protein
MMSGQETLFASVFAAALIGLAVYFIRLNVVVVWPRVASRFFRAAVVTSCAWLWSLCAIGFVAYGEALARQSRHSHFSQLLHSGSGVFLAIIIITFVISLAAGVIGFAESSLRGRRII